MHPRSPSEIVHFIPYAVDPVMVVNGQFVTDGNRSNQFSMNPFFLNLLPKNVRPKFITKPITDVRPSTDQTKVDLTGKHGGPSISNERLVESWHAQGSKLLFASTNRTENCGQLLIVPDRPGGSFYLLEVDPQLVNEIQTIVDQYDKKQPPLRLKVGAQQLVGGEALSRLQLEVIHVTKIDGYGQTVQNNVELSARFGIPQGAEVMIWPQVTALGQIEVDYKRDIVKFKNENGQWIEIELRVFRSSFAGFGRKRTITSYIDGQGKPCVAFAFRNKFVNDNNQPMNCWQLFTMTKEVFDGLTQKTYNSTADSAMRAQQAPNVDTKKKVDLEPQGELKIQPYGQTDQGRVREHNEDSFWVPQEINLPGIGKFRLAVVADGMGGHAAGEVASGIVVKQFQQAFSAENLKNLFRERPSQGDLQSGQFLKQLLSNPINEANARVYHQAERNPNQAGMGTTVAAAATFTPEGSNDTYFAMAHMGDSRVYGFNATEATPWTTDHSWVAEQVAAGVIEPEEAPNHPYRNVITKVVGQNLNSRPDIAYGKLPKGVALLLCSDGLSGPVDQTKMNQVIQRNSGNSRKLVDELIAAANNNGGPDNITAAVLN